jgi:hypothetical protein
MKLPLLVLFTVLTADAAAAARPVSPAIQQIRARYQQVLEALERAGGQAPFTMAVNPADSSSKASVLVSFAAPDGFDVESNDQTLQLARVVETWSNLGPQTSEYLYDPQGELLFHSPEIRFEPAGRDRWLGTRGPGRGRGGRWRGDELTHRPRLLDLPQ